MKIDTKQLRASRSKCISLNYAIELVQLCSQMYQQSPKIVLLLGVLNIDRFATWILFGFFAVFKSSDSWSFRSLPIEYVAKKSAIWVLFISFPCDFWFFFSGGSSLQFRSMVQPAARSFIDYPATQWNVCVCALAFSLAFALCLIQSRCD